MKTLLVLVLVALSAVNATPVQQQRKRYDGYRLISITPSDDHQLSVLKKLQAADDTLDFWLEPTHVGREVHLLVSPKKFSSVRVKMLANNIQFKTLVENIQKNLDIEQKRLDEKRSKGKMPYDYMDYNDFDTVLEELGVLNAECNADPQLTCSITTIGQSVEERPLQVLHISKTGAAKPGVWFDSTIHAREWLSTATHFNVLSRIIRDHNTDPIVQQWLNTYDFHVLPVMNPDGYAHTWSNDRLWRKSRNVNIGSNCLGTDLNRNYPFLWATGGSSASPCSETYHGSAAGSEPETQAVEAEGRRLAASLDVWITFHTYGQYWLIPWGDCSLPADYPDLFSVGQATITAIENTHGTSWLNGNSCQVLYETSGSTADWAKGAINVKYSYTPELRGDPFGFDPPPAYIQPSYEEIWNGLVAMFNRIAEIPKK